jgi:dolichol-phosphate mannosyltransferase
LIQLTPNSGQSAAFGVGFQYAKHPIIVTMDADGQNDPADIPLLLDGLEDADVCCGYRHNRQDTASKRLASRIGNRIRNAFLGSDIIDTGCSLKAFRADFVRHLTMHDGMHRFLPNLCAMQGARINQIPVNHRPRTSGVSKYTNFGRLLKTVPDLLAVRWMKTRTRRFQSKEIS